MTPVSHDPDTVAFGYCWDHASEPARKLALAFPDISETEIAHILERAARLYHAVDHHPFYGQPRGPSIPEAVSYLQREVPGLTDSAYRLASDRVCFLYAR
jgi:hypothetical protein